ncbi:MAG: hypothetical protein AABZ32_03535 [Bacteroidota bacterium]
MLDERKQIEELEAKVRGNSSYGKLSPNEIDLIELGIKRRKFQYCFDGDRIQECPWHLLFSKTGVKTDLLDEMYRYLSLSTHPSNVSVFQFANMFKSKSHLDNSFFLLKLSKTIMAFSIRDYAIFYPEIKLIFNGLPEENQILVNGYNRLFKNESFVVNDVENYV